MDFSKLQSIVKPSGSLLGLTIKDLESARLDALGESCLPEGKLSLRDARSQDDGSSITIAGTGTSAPFLGMEVTAVFHLDNQEPELLVTAIGGQDWTFDKSFPLLRNSPFAGLKFKPSPTLYLSSSKVSDAIAAGLSFEGVLDPGSDLGALATLAGAGEHKLTGGIELFRLEPELLLRGPAVAPSIMLVGPVNTSADLGFVTLSNITYSLYSDPRYNTANFELETDAYIGWNAELTFSAQGRNHTIPVWADIYDPQHGILFAADLRDGVDAVLDELSVLANGAGLAIPLDGFHTRDTIRLTDLQMLVNPAGTKKIGYVTIGIETGEAFSVPLIPDLIALDAVDVDFRIDDPLGEKLVTGVVSGLVGIGEEGTLELSASFGAERDSFAFGGALREGNRLNIKEVFEHFMKLGNSDLPDLSLVRFNFFMHPSAEIYSGEISLEGDWPFPGVPQFRIFDLQFRLDHPAKGQDTRFHAQGVVGIADVHIAVRTSYEGVEAGWTFAGSTGPGQKIPIGTLIADLAELFGDDIKGKLPSAIADLTIEDLGVSFNTKTRDFSFTCKAQFPVDSNAKVAITVVIELTHNSGAYKKDFGGKIEANLANRKDPLVFTLEFVEEKAEGKTADLFIATYEGGDQKLNIGDLIRAIVQDQPDWTHALDGVEIDLKDALFAFSKTGEEKKFLFGLDIGADISLSELPLVGKEFPPERKFGIDDLQLLIASRSFSATEVKKLNGLLPDKVTQLPDISKSAGAKTVTKDDAETIALKKGLNVGAKLKLGETTRDLALPAIAAGSTDGNQPSETTTTPNQAATTTDNATWLKVQKSLGPMHLERVGAQYKDAAVWFLLDAALSAVGLTLSLDGLSIGSPINKFEPRFELRGLGIDYRNDALEIGGAFLKMADREYAGAAVIKAKQLTLSALGMYKEMADGHPSVFVYAVLDYPLGGPSFFFVTGLAAGFGYSRALKIPEIDRVASFSLVENARKGAGMPKDIGAELQKLASDITPAAGENFLAIGVKFTSFKIVDSFALLTISFGSHFELNLLGLSNLVAPPNAGPSVPPVAEVQLALKASFLPDKGFLGVQALLTPNSYLLSKACHLTGGFAFFSWFAGSEHDGDFVLTLGGYHPHFRVPAHYPSVPRLGFNWQVSPELSIKGDAYFALTASALMAGGHLEANWRSGSIHAWFKLGADFLIAWKPYHYEIHAYVDLGVEVTFEFFGTQHITIDVGADLSIWGPEFSGEATIHLWIISFTVEFGAAASHTPPPIDWPTFKESFLPADKDVCTVAVTGGLIGKDSQDASDLGVINPKYFLLATNSVIPSTAAQVALKGAKQNVALSRSPGRFGIASMAVAAADLASTQTITIKREGVLAGDEFEYTPIFKNAPAGLWGESLTPAVNGKQFVENALSGFEIRPKASPKPGETAAIERSKLQADGFSGTGEYAWESVKPFAAASFDSEQKRRDELQKKLAAGAPGRNAILTALGFTAKDLGKIALETLRAEDFLIAPQIEK